MAISGTFGLGGFPLKPGQPVWFFKQGGEEPARVYVDARRTQEMPNPIVTNSLGELPMLWFEHGETVWAKTA